MEAIFEDQAPLVIFLTVVFTLLAAAVSAHFLSSEKTRQPVRRIALWVAAGVSSVVAFFASMGFGIPRTVVLMVENAGIIPTGN